MFQYFLAFLLINSYYLSLGNPIQQRPLISESLTALVSQCENSFLTTAISAKIKDCALSVPPYNKKQIRCLIFYDINKQLCAAVAVSKLAISADFDAKIEQKQDVNTVCTEAKDWIFTNISEYTSYKNSSEKLLKSPATCGEICGVEETMNEANYYCKYYKWGIELVKAQLLASTANNINKDAVDPPDTDSNPKADIPVPINNNQLSPQTSNTNTLNVQIKQTESTVSKTVPEKTEESGDVAVGRSTPQTVSSSKQPVSADNVQTSNEKNEAEVLDHPIDPDLDMSRQSNNSTLNNESKPYLEIDPQVLSESGKDMGNIQDSKKIAVENTDGKAGIPDDYTDSEGNDPADDDGEDLDIKSDLEMKQDSSLKTNLILPHNGDMSQQKEDTIPVTYDTFSDDGDHFLPFFLTAVVMVVLLYVLYHNKNKVTKVFFGLILEGRQSSRRRNSRGHAYRRLDTLEQAMSANTAAPPSKIIY